MAKYTIIADSACDLKEQDIKSANIDFTTVPLSIIINDENVVDEESLDTKAFVKSMKTNTSKPATACPSPEAFADKIRAGGDIVFIVTITSKLSGTYNSARLAADTVMAEDKNKKVFIVDSLSASAGEVIIIHELIKLIESGKYSFEQICDKISEIRSATRVRFVLQDFTNLIKTGRMSKAKAVVANVLNFKLICGDNGEGEIKPVTKTMGMKKAITALAECVADKKGAPKDMPIVISHCHNEEDANSLKATIEAKYGFTNIRIIPMRGLACFYANDKGMLLSY
jgi:DegV family protein with EDD domain